MHDRKLTVCGESAGPEIPNEPVKETSVFEQPPVPHSAAQRAIVARLAQSVAERQESAKHIGGSGAPDPGTTYDALTTVSTPAKSTELFDFPSVAAASLPFGPPLANEPPEPIAEVGEFPSQSLPDEAPSKAVPILPGSMPAEPTAEDLSQTTSTADVDVAWVSSEPIRPASEGVEAASVPELPPQTDVQSFERSAPPAMSRSYYAGQAPAAIDSSETSQWKPETRTQPTAIGKIPQFIFRTVRYLMLALAVWYAAMVALIAVFGIINPPTSALMLIRAAQGVDIDQRWVPLEKISPNLVRAVIVSEDGRFCRHWGIDPREIMAAIRRANGGTPRGASTITMQLSKNLFLWPQQSYVRKALEVPLTLTIDALWSKARIAEVYLNIVEWGPGIFGAEAAARRHFDRAAAKLSTRQAALLAVALPSPIRRKPGSPSRLMNKMASTIVARMRAMSSADDCVTEAR